MQSLLSKSKPASPQLRSAISHLNEVWAIAVGGVILSAFADLLPWEWIHDSARWTYDESRHCQMGYERLITWGLDPAETTVGTYIHDTAAGVRSISWECSTSW